MYRGSFKMANNDKSYAPQANSKLESMKTEIANEFGVHLGADTTARQNGSVGGEITKRLVAQSLGNKK